MSKLRKLARGQDCQIRLEGICNHNPETVVLAHLRMSGITGTGMKANDILGSWACSECHRATESNPDMRIYHSIVEEAGRIKYTYFVPMMSYAEDQDAVAAQWVIKDLEKRLGYERIVKLLGLSVISSTRHLSVKHFEEALNNMMEGERQHNLTDPSSYTGKWNE